MLGEHPEALAWLEDQARGGDVYATLSLGMVLQDGGGKLRDTRRAETLWKTALTSLVPAAEQGDAASSYALSLMYRGGYGVPRNAQRRRELLVQSGDRLQAMVELAEDFGEGDGGGKEPTRALELMQRAATAGHPWAQLRLGDYYYFGRNGARKDVAQALNWYALSAAQGSAVAQFSLGLIHSGPEVAERNMAAAAQSYERAAAQGHVGAKTSLATLFRDGDGVAVDLDRAVALFLQAAVAGDVIAQTNLAEMYRDGTGVTADLKEAEKWFVQAADQGLTRAELGLAEVRRRMQCEKTAHTLLFGVLLKCSTRAELRRAVAHAGGLATREKDEHWVDLYDSSKLLDESTELQISYTGRDQGFARATYVFQSGMDTELVDRVTQMVISKYGRPQRVKGYSNVGDVTREWRLQDGLVLQISRDWRASTTYVTYTFPENQAALEHEEAERKQRWERAKRRRQVSAF